MNYNGVGKGEVSMVGTESGAITKYFNCLQSALYNFDKRFSDNPEYLFSNCFGMEYNPNIGEFFFDRIKPRITVEFYNSFGNLYGIEFEEIAPAFTPDFLEAIGETHNILVFLDAYYCNWSEAYKKVHFAHFCVVTSVNHKKKALVCLDPYIGKEEEWPVDLFILGFISGYRIKILVDKTPCLDDVKKILFDNVDIEDVKLKYDYAINDLSKIVWKRELFETSNPTTCKVIVFSKQISDNYRGLSCLITSIDNSDSKYYHQLKEIVYMLKCAGEKWHYLNMIFIKLNMKPDLDMKQITVIVKTLREIEKLDIEIIEKFYLTVRDL